VIALFDTNSASYWIGGNEKFKFRLAQIMGELKRKQGTLALSTVSLQEMLVYSRSNGTHDRDYQFIVERFNILPFDEPCAIAAARLAAAVGSPNRPDRRRTRGGSATQQVRDVWQRDAAIAGTAEHHGVDILVTADATLHTEFRDYLTRCEVRLLEEGPAPVGASEPTPSEPSSSS
jgi:predicted nucleic acid-binding protein